MRFVFFLTSVLMLYLVVIPCTDSMAEKGYGYEAHFHKSEKPDGRDHQPEDFCSPFCSCSCCQMITSFSEPSCLDFAFMGNLENYQGHQHNIAVLFSGAVWHPPRAVPGRKSLIFSEMV